MQRELAGAHLRGGSPRAGTTRSPPGDECQAARAPRANAECMLASRPSERERLPSGSTATSASAWRTQNQGLGADRRAVHCLSRGEHQLTLAVDHTALRTATEYRADAGVVLQSTYSCILASISFNVSEAPGRHGVRGSDVLQNVTVTVANSGGSWSIRCDILATAMAAGAGSHGIRSSWCVIDGQIRQTRLSGGCNRWPFVTSVGRR